MIATPYYSFCTSPLLLAVEYLARHQFDTFFIFLGISTSYSTNSRSVIVDRSNSAGNVRTVISRVDSKRILCEIIPKAVIALLFRVFPHVRGQILMIEIYTCVHNSDYNVGVACLIGLPYGKNIHIASADR